MPRFTVTYRHTDNQDIYHEMIINARNINLAERYFRTEECTEREFIGISETADSKPGRPEITVPGSWQEK